MASIDQKEFRMGALSSLSGVQFSGLPGTSSPFSGKGNNFVDSTPDIAVGEHAERPLPYKKDTYNSFTKAMAWRKHGSLSYGKTSMGSTFDFTA
jgi:hypothetical protein